MNLKVTPEQLEILQHTIGTDQFGRRRCDRNHYVAGLSDVPLCRDLVKAGLMIERSSSALTGGDPLFVATDAGTKLVTEQSPAPPKTTRSGRRYAAFINADSGMKFGEWLRTSA